MSFSPGKSVLCLEMPLSIGVLIPTRKRPQRLFNSIKSLVSRAQNPQSLQILIAVDNDDPASVDLIQKEIIPYLDSHGVSHLTVSYNRQGYANLHNYYNDLAGYAKTKWLMVWNDDAVMDTQDWDAGIREYDGRFCVLAFDTHRHHPYSIFPVVPRDWYALVGRISNHQMVDSVVSQMAYMLDIMVRTDIKVNHERYDFTGETPDETHLERELYENNIEDPKDLNHPESVRWRYQMTDRIAWYLKSHGHDISWWVGVLSNTQDPWARLKENDPNQQVYIGSVKI